MEQEIKTSAGTVLTTTRCPIKINGEILKYSLGALALSQHNDSLTTQFAL